MEKSELQLSGYWYPPNAGLRVEATLFSQPNGRLLCTGSREEFEAIEVDVAEIEVSPRIANTIRWIRLPGGARFETSNNDAVDSFLADRRMQKLPRLIHRLESAWTYTLVALAVIVATVWALTSYVIPAAAPQFAALVPASVESELGARVDTILERSMPRVTEEPGRMVNLRVQFNELVEATGSEYPYTLTLRDHSMPNAMALPGGPVSITSGLLDKASDEEIVAVLAHEIGHVEGRHGLKSIMRQAGTLALFTTLFGDVSGSAILIYAPTLLTELKYSRDTESSADSFAVELLQDTGRDPEHLASFFETLIEHDREEGLGGEESDSDILDYLSTHPGHVERIKAIRSHSQP